MLMKYRQSKYIHVQLSTFALSTRQGIGLHLHLNAHPVFGAIYLACLTTTIPFYPECLTARVFDLGFSLPENTQLLFRFFPEIRERRYVLNEKSWCDVD